MDYWRRKYLLEAIKKEKKIALIGIGDVDEYLKHDKKTLSQIWNLYL